MQTVEAVVSLLFFASVCSFLFSDIQESRQIDDSLYRAQIGEDIWRVLYLRGNFRDFNSNSRYGVEQELDEISELTGYCVFLNGIYITNCRGGIQQHDTIVSLEKSVVYHGVPRNLAFSIAK
ncbi:hypothetical protein GF318_01430 [Candidatus Micrarchaeota archaeon]|nr:hypothetical protein [Candidatus Micrarchaeota archaeon]